MAKKLIRKKNLPIKIMKTKFKLSERVLHFSQLMYFTFSNFLSNNLWESASSCSFCWVLTVRTSLDSLALRIFTCSGSCLRRQLSGFARGYVRRAGRRSCFLRRCCCWRAGHTWRWWRDRQRKTGSRISAWGSSTGGSWSGFRWACSAWAPAFRCP